MRTLNIASTLRGDVPLPLAGSQASAEHAVESLTQRPGAVEDASTLALDSAWAYGGRPGPTPRIGSAPKVPAQA